MPSGLPSLEQLQTQTIRGFSIDTSIYREFGFRFHEGQLAVLHQQVPSWFSLYTSDVVLRETQRQAIQKPKEAVKRLTDSVAAVSTQLGVDLTDVRETLKRLALDEQVNRLIKQRFERFSRSLHGGVVDLAGISTKALFEAYFSEHPPFARSGDKKSEFPDAAALFSIEFAARRDKCQIILVSSDKGWHDFAAVSECLFCVDSIEALASLFESTSPVAVELRARIVGVIESENENFLASIRRNLDATLDQVFWYTDAYSESPNITVGVDIRGADLLNVSLKKESVRLWTHTEDARSCVLEVEASLECDFEYTAHFQRVSPLTDKLYEFGDESGQHRESVRLSLLLTLEGDLTSGTADNWNVKVEVAHPLVHVYFGRIDPDWSKYHYAE